MVDVFLGLGANVDRERSMRAGLQALRILDPQLLVSQLYESDAVGFVGAPFYNCVVQFHTSLVLTELIKTLKAIEQANGRDRSCQNDDGKGLDIDVLTYGDLTGFHEGIELPREDIVRYAHVLRPLAEIAPQDCLPGTQRCYGDLWQSFDAADQHLEPIDFEYTH